MTWYLYFVNYLKLFIFTVVHIRWFFFFRYEAKKPGHCAYYSTTNLNPQALDEDFYWLQMLVCLSDFTLNCFVLFVYFLPPEAQDKGCISVEYTQSWQECHHHWAVSCHLIIDSIICEFPFAGTSEMLSPEPLWSKLNHGDKSATVFCMQWQII